MANPVITVTGVTKAVGNRRLLDSVSFTIDESSLVSLIGPNGAGKSTLVRIVLGLDSKYEGTVNIRAGERIQYIPQLAPNDAYQLPISVREYLAVGVSGPFQVPYRLDYSHALEHVGVSAQKLNQSFQTLSGGERQRVAIARALLAEPTILVLDEPLAAVDFASRGGLYSLIRHLQLDHQMTVLLVSHDLESVLPLSDRIFSLDGVFRTDCHPKELTSDHIASHHTEPLSCGGHT